MLSSELGLGDCLPGLLIDKPRAMRSASVKLSLS
jgi:hypothetical protein